MNPNFPQYFPYNMQVQWSAVQELILFLNSLRDTSFLWNLVEDVIIWVHGKKESLNSDKRYSVVSFLM